MPQNDNYITASRSALERLVLAHDGDMALLYLYRLLSGDRNEENAAGALCRTLSEMQAASEKLQRLQLQPVFSDAVPTEVPAAAAGSAAKAAEKLTPMGVDDVAAPPPREYTSAEITAAAEEDSVYASLLVEARNLMGRLLSTEDMKSILRIYKDLALPGDVIMMLFAYMSDVYQEKYHGSRLPTARAIEREANLWASRGVTTYEAAEAYLAERSRITGVNREIAEILGITGRDLTPAEQKYVSAWVDLGMKTDAISIAYDRTMLNTGKMSWPYMDTILRTWADKKLFTAADVEQADPRRSRRNDAPAGAEAAVDVDRLKNFLNNM